MIPEATNFLRQKIYTTREELAEVLIEFTQLHVDAALNKASENVFYTTSRDRYRNITAVAINKESILNAYPTENIK